MNPERSYADRIARAQVTIGVVALGVGVVGLYISRHLAFATSAGATTGWSDYEFGFMRYNSLSALLTMGIGGLGLVAGLLRQQLAAWLGVVISAGMAVLVLAQWRVDSDTNLLAGTGRNFAFSLLLAVGLATTATLLRLAHQTDTDTDTDTDADADTGSSSSTRHP